ncbi:MAG: cytochrome P450 [Actinobacteria bacterium]|nr:cytochrome P450 [Actinomycetota bacterium]MCB8995708.1 cytochrome P450 [Actinomycetota bacterium]MCB9425391.1 cytochrome P450 [Actinomycetota bacterium]HRY10591.1 cytochrome P450 [Candidatus Nanopelagicales bacterium]
MASSTVTQRTLNARTIVESMRVQQPAVARPPGPNGLRSMWSLASGQVPPHEFFSSLRERHQPIVHVPMAGEHLNVLFAPEAIWEVFVTNGRHTRKSLALQMTRPLLGDGLLTADGPTHMRHRRALQPLFHNKRIEGYVADMVGAADASGQRWHGGQLIDLSDAMAELTLDVIGRTVFGLDVRGEASDVATALDTVLAGFARGIGPWSSPLSRIPTARRRREVEAIRELDAIVEEMIASRRRDLAMGFDGKDVLTLMLAARDDDGRSAFTPEEVRDEAMTLVLAGHETTALALTWAWNLLSHNPSERAWLEQELDSLPERPLTAHDLPSLPRTYAVIAEAMRLHPPAWILGRWLDKDLRVSGWDLPRGSVVLASQYAMHRDPRYWPHADAFRPTRWITDGRFDERAPRVPRGVWFPFGFGTRRCIGEHFAWTEAVVVLATLARRWRLEVHAPADPPMMSAITLRPAIPMSTTLTTRA